MVYSWKNDGPLGLFDKGKLSSQIVRDVPYAIVTLVSYEILQNLVARAMKRKEINADEKTTLENRNSRNKTSASSKEAYAAFPKIGFSSIPTPSKKLRDALCGSLAGGLGSLVTTPIDEYCVPVIIRVFTTSIGVVTRDPKPPASDPHSASLNFLDEARPD